MKHTRENGDDVPMGRQKARLEGTAATILRSPWLHYPSEQRELCIDLLRTKSTDVGT